MIRYVFDMERGQLRPAKENDSQTLPGKLGSPAYGRERIQRSFRGLSPPENVKKKPLTCPVL